MGAGPVGGGAGNRLTTPQLAELLADRGGLHCPGNCLDAGGVIQLADELRGFSFERARARTERIFDTMPQVRPAAGSEGITPALAADRSAGRRIAEVSGLRRIHLR